MKVLLFGHTSAIAQGVKPYLKDYEVIEQSSRSFELHDTDVVINFAGILLESELSKAHLLSKKLVEVNCLGAVSILFDYLPLMKRNNFGRIILFSSIFSKINVKGYGVYSASKAFIDKLVQVAAIENGQYGVTVNSIQLGYTGVGMGIETPELVRNRIPLKRFVTMEEIYKTIDFIIKNEYINGQNINLSSGL